MFLLSRWRSAGSRRAGAVFTPSRVRSDAIRSESAQVSTVLVVSCAVLSTVLWSSLLKCCYVLYANKWASSLLLSLSSLLRPKVGNL